MQNREIQLKKIHLMLKFFTRSKNIDFWREAGNYTGNMANEKNPKLTPKLNG